MSARRNRSEDYDKATAANEGRGPDLQNCHPADALLSPNGDWAKLPLFEHKGWKRLPFGAFAENVNERVEPAEAADEVYVGLEHLDSQDLHIRRWGKGSDVVGTKLRFRKGDIIFGRRRAYQRKLAVAEMDGICSAHAMVVRAKPEVLPEFLPFLMMRESFMNRAMEISVGSLSPTINWTALKTQEFDLPPLDQQRRIAEILVATDEMVQRAQAMRGTVLSLADAMLHAFLYTQGPWRSVSCEEALAAGPRNGLSPPTTADEADGVPTLSISAIRDGAVVTEGNVKFVRVSKDHASAYRLESGDVLIVRGNGNRLLCGRAGIVDSTPAGCIYPDLLISVRFRAEVLLTEFAVMQWNEAKTHAQLLSRAKSTNGIWKVNGQDIRKHKLLAPPIPAQREFIGRIQQISGLLAVCSETVARGTMLRGQLTNSLSGTL